MSKLAAIAGGTLITASTLGGIPAAQADVEDLDPEVAQIEADDLYSMDDDSSPDTLENPVVQLPGGSYTKIEGVSLWVAGRSPVLLQNQSEEEPEVEAKENTDSGTWESLVIVSPEGDLTNMLRTEEGVFSVGEGNTITFTPTEGFSGRTETLSYQVITKSGDLLEGTTAFDV